MSDQPIIQCVRLLDTLTYPTSTSGVRFKLRYGGERIFILHSIGWYAPAGLSKIELGPLSYPQLSRTHEKQWCQVQRTLVT